jgi:DNA polymerase I
MQGTFKTVIVDGPYLVHRSFSLPFRLTTSTGLDSTMIHSFLVSLNAMYKKFTPKQTIITWESYGTKSWRKELQTSYKQDRTPVSNEYVDALRDLQLILYFLGIRQYNSPTNEADDVIATLVQKEENLPSIIFTVDKDIMQLINQNIWIWNGKVIVDSFYVREKFGVAPGEIPDLLALWGDTSDGIEGIKGFGLKKASQRINQFYYADFVPGLFDHIEQIQRNKKLATLKKDCELVSIPNSDFKTDKTLDSLLDKYELRKIKENINQYKSICGNTCQS